MLTRNYKKGTVRVHRWVSEDTLLEYAATIASERLSSAGPIGSPDKVADYLRHIIGTRDVEQFYVILLNTRNFVISHKTLFTGTIDGASVHPREVVRYALMHNAAAIVVGHNHPSGIAEPSQADIKITVRLRDALLLIDIRLLDHVIIGGNTQDFVSLASRGLI